MQGILQPILKSLFPAQKECLQQGFFDLPAAYQGNQADISVSCGAFHLSPFFGQRKLNIDEPMEQREHIKFDIFLGQDLLCICSILSYNLC